MIEKTVEDMNDILTDADIEAIQADLVDDDIGDVRREVERFAKADVCGEPSQYDVWFGSILEILSEDRCRPFRGVVLKDSIVALFRKNADQALADHIDEYDDDPAKYMSYWGHRSNPHEEHPWGKDVMARCDKFIETATPYMVWRFYKDVRRETEEALEANLVEMAFLGNQEHPAMRVARAAKRAMEHAIARLEVKLMVP